MKKSFKHLISVLSAAFFACFLFSGCAPAGTADGASGGAGSYSGIIVLVVMLVVFYFFLIRPENKKKKQVEQMRSSLSIGDEITTIGAMTGKIVQVTEDTVTFETGEDRVRIQIKKWGVSTTAKMEAAEAEAQAAKRRGRK